MNRNLSIITVLYLTFSTPPVYAQQPFLTSLTNDPRLEQQVSQLRDIILEQDKKISQQEEEIQAVRGENEVLSHRLEQIKQQQQDIYLDIDQRLRQLQEKISSTGNPVSPSSEAEELTTSSDPLSSPTTQPGSSSVESADTMPPPTGVPSADTQPPVTESAETEDVDQEKTFYQNTFKQLQDGNYGQAIEGFNIFLANYPNGEFADNAQYWLAESYYADRQFNEALIAFQKLVERYPDSPKRGHAQLKIGYVYYEINDYESARNALEEVIRTYPNAAVARLAQQRLLKIE